MSTPIEEFEIVDEVPVSTEPAGKKDETYYWADNVTFSVEEILFRVPPYPFFLGSEYFVAKFGLLSGEYRSGVVYLEGVTAAQFRVLLKFLFPIHLTSTTATFTKDEWLTILRLSTLWHFHDARKLAIRHLDGQLSDLELVLVGRAAYVPRWVLAGYRAIIEKPRLYTLTEDIGVAIGHREVNRLWAIRYHCAVLAYDVNFVRDALREKFAEELAGLAARALEHRTDAEVKQHQQDAEERALRGAGAWEAGGDWGRAAGLTATMVSPVDGYPQASSSGFSMVGFEPQVLNGGASDFEGNILAEPHMTGPEVFNADGRKMDPEAQAAWEAKMKAKREMIREKRLARSRARAAAEEAAKAHKSTEKGHDEEGTKLAGSAQSRNDWVPDPALLAQWPPWQSGGPQTSSTGPWPSRQTAGDRTSFESPAPLWSGSAATASGGWAQFEQSGGNRAAPAGASRQNKDEYTPGRSGVQGWV